MHAELLHMQRPHWRQVPWPSCCLKQAWTTPCLLFSAVHHSDTSDLISRPLPACPQVPDVTSLLSTMEDYLKDYNSMSKRPMSLAMFLFAVEHISRIVRLLKQPRGNMLLVGVGGSGRQSLTRLAAFICGMDLFSVEISKSYGRAEWREDLKKVLRRWGGCQEWNRSLCWNCTHSSEVVLVKRLLLRHRFIQSRYSTIRVGAVCHDRLCCGQRASSSRSITLPRHCNHVTDRP